MADINVNASGADLNTPLHLLMMHFDKESKYAEGLASYLIRKGARLNAKNKDGYTPLHLGILCNQTKALEYALGFNGSCEKRAKRFRFDFDAKGGKHGFSILHSIVVQNNLYHMTILLNSKESIDLDAIDNEGRFARDLIPFNSPMFKLLKKAAIQRVKLK